MTTLTAIPGVAHFAGTGPVSRACKDCQFYSDKRCGQYRRMTGQKGKPFASTTPACKYFEEARRG